MKYKLALIICAMACDLDHFKNTLPVWLNTPATLCVEVLHDIAEALLGKDAGKVYALADEGTGQ